MAVAMDEVEGGWEDVERVEALLTKTTLPLATLSEYLTCFFVEKTCPVPFGSDEAPSLDPAFVRVNPNVGLQSYTLKPKQFFEDQSLPPKNRLPLFKHMTRMRNRQSKWVRPPTSDLWCAVDYLDLEITSDNRSVVEPTILELQEGQLLKEIGTTEASRRMPRRRLNALGEVNSQCVHANAPERMKKLRFVAQLAESVEKVKVARALTRGAAAADRAQDAAKQAPGGIAKLTSGSTPIH